MSGKRSVASTPQGEAKRQRTDGDRYEVPADFVPLVFSGEPVKISKDNEVWLIRIPTEVDTESLDGVVVDATKGARVAIKSDADEKKMRLERTAGAEAAGPVLLLSRAGKGTLAPHTLPIDAQFALVHAFDVPPPGVGSYARPAIVQPDNLKQRWLPFGSGSPIVSRAADAPAATPSKSHEPKGMEQPARKPKEGAKKEKKEKKEKKSKKDKKEKKSKKEKSVSTDED